MRNLPPPSFSAPISIDEYDPNRTIGARNLSNIKLAMSQNGSSAIMAVGSHKIGAFTTPTDHQIAVYEGMVSGTAVDWRRIKTLPLDHRASSSFDISFFGNDKYVIAYQDDNDNIVSQTGKLGADSHIICPASYYGKGRRPSISMNDHGHCVCTYIDDESRIYYRTGTISGLYDIHWHHDCGFPFAGPANPVVGGIFPYVSINNNNQILIIWTADDTTGRIFHCTGKLNMESFCIEFTDQGIHNGNGYFPTVALRDDGAFFRVFRSGKLLAQPGCIDSNGKLQFGSSIIVPADPAADSGLWTTIACAARGDLLIQAHSSDFSHGTETMDLPGLGEFNREWVVGSSFLWYSLGSAPS